MPDDRPLPQTALVEQDPPPAKIMLTTPMDTKASRLTVSTPFDSKTVGSSSNNAQYLQNTSNTSNPHYETPLWTSIGRQQNPLASRLAQLQPRPQTSSSSFMPKRASSMDMQYAQPPRPLLNQQRNPLASRLAQFRPRPHTGSSSFMPKRASSMEVHSSHPNRTTMDNTSSRDYQSPIFAPPSRFIDDGPRRAVPLFDYQQPRNGERGHENLFRHTRSFESGQPEFQPVRRNTERPGSMIRTNASDMGRGRPSYIKKSASDMGGGRPSYQRMGNEGFSAFTHLRHQQGRNNGLSGGYNINATHSFDMGMSGGMLRHQRASFRPDGRQEGTGDPGSLAELRSSRSMDDNDAINDALQGWSGEIQQQQYQPNRVSGRKGLGGPRRQFRFGDPGKSRSTYFESEKMHACMYCPKRFLCRSSLRRHIRMHTGERLVKCPHCSKEVCDKATLKMHMRSHTGEKPFQCETCKKCFTQKGNLNRHIRNTPVCKANWKQTPKQKSSIESKVNA